MGNGIEVSEKITITCAEYSKLQETIQRQQTEIDALEYRIETLLSR